MMNNTEELIDSFIEIVDVNPDDFHLIKETLTRIGLVSRKNKEEDGRPTLWQSVHILFKKKRYFLVHFKQLFLLDGRQNKTEFTDDDKNRLYLIVNLLKEWGLIKLKDPSVLNDIEEISKHTDIVIIRYNEKGNWNLRSKYTIGKNKSNIKYED